MGYKHLPWKRLREELGSGKLETSQLTDVLDHLAELCPDCAREMQAWRPASSASGPPTSYQEAIESRLSSLQEIAGELEALVEQAREDLQHLLALPVEARRPTIERGRSRYRSPFLVDFFLEECSTMVTRDPFAALELAECAHTVALRIPHTLFSEVWAMTSAARATAHRGNALRAAGETQHGARLIETGLSLVERQGFDDPYVEAELYGMLASARKDQRRFDDALCCLDHTIEVYSQVEDEPGVGRALLHKCFVYFDLGDPAQALETVDQALPLIDRSRDEALYLMAIHNRAYSLVDLERYEEARDLVVEYAALYQGTTPLLRQQWLLGRIARGLGQLDAAEHTLFHTRRGFLRAQLPLDAALSGLDLALVYLDLGKHDELRELAEEMLPVFKAQDIERETIASLLLFQQAAREQAVTRAMLEELAGYLQRVRIPSR